jgi:hypothetical protein
MYRPLAPCASCGRHVLGVESECPFCGSALAQAPAAAASGGARGSRAAVFALGATLLVTGCSTTSTDPGAPVALYGGPPSDAAAEEDAGPGDDGSVAALYGAVPADAGTDAADDGGPDDAGGAVPKYGAPPVDSGK